MHKLFVILLSFLYIIGCSNSNEVIKEGKDSLIFKNIQSKSSPEIKVWTYKPTKYFDNSKILFVMHGNKRNGDVYRDQWMELAEKNSVLLIVPEFSQKYFPEDDNYNMGNMFIMDSTENLLKKNPKNEWSYSIIEPLFDFVKKITGNMSERYSMFGHSAGSQFVHRFLFFIPNARIDKAVSANAGWYTLPDTSAIFPYGFKKTEATAESIKNVFAKQVTILLGTSDTVRIGKSLRRTREAMAQGSNRFERGKSFFHFAKELAKKNNLKFSWSLEFVENVGHKNKKMAPPAAKILFN
ncbi:MAG: hypothetical protein L3J41_11160 [Melioribacteraceae bacterium]|nr:hypothetical protein [Melioribacteraceae bacterium]